MSYEIVTIGASWGGLKTVERLLCELPDGFPLPVVVCQHRSPDAPEGGLSSYYRDACNLPVGIPDDKEPILPGHVYFAPADYHLLVEPDGFSLSVDERVRGSRPSIDVLFDSVAHTYGNRAIGIILTGANDDGAQGLVRIKEAGGWTMVQDPSSAERSEMPLAAIRAGAAREILPVDDIGTRLLDLVGEVVR